MKLFQILGTLFVYVPIILVSCVSQNETFIVGEIANIPACGLECLEWTVPAVGCSILNFTCQCASQKLIDITSTCMMTNCTLQQAVELDKVQAAICERPYQSRNKLIKVTTIVCMTITYLAVIVRLITRYCLNQRYGIDDWLIVAAAATDFVFTYFGIQFERNGFGEHVWEIDIDKIPELLYWFFLCEVFYVITISLIKLSVLTFYLKVFPTRNFRIQVWSVMAFCIATGIAFAFATIFQCRPLSFVWNKNDPSGKCINFNSTTWANGAFNIFQDILIVLLPISEVRKLQLGQKKKIGLYIMFGLGGFVCITSMVRLYTLKTFGLTADPTWDNIPITFWTTLETTTAVLCTCLPSIRAGLLRLFPRVFGTTVHPSTSTIVTNKSNGGYQQNAASVSAMKSWPARKLASISSLSIRDEEAQTTSNAREVFQHVELARIDSGRSRKELIGGRRN